MTSDLCQCFNPKLLDLLIVISQTETLNCDISSLENDTETSGHSINRKFSGASYD